MKYKEYENWTAINVGDFRANLAEVIEAMEDSGVPIIVTRRNVPLLQLTPVSLRAYRSMLRNMQEFKKKAAAEKNEGLLKQMEFAVSAIEGKIAELTDNQKVLLRSQADLKKMMIETVPLFQQYLNSPEDSAMLESNMSVGEAEADKQGERSVVRPAKSVTKKKKTSARSDKLPPRSGGKSLGDRVKR
jgi:prevent-host-death family protein